MTTTRKFPAKIALLKSMEELLHHKSFAKISVNELCQHAQISRSAFYANFADKYERTSFLSFVYMNGIHRWILFYHLIPQKILFWIFLSGFKLSNASFIMLSGHRMMMKLKKYFISSLTSSLLLY